MDDRTLTNACNTHIAPRLERLLGPWSTTAQLGLLVLVPIAIISYPGLMHVSAEHPNVSNFASLFACVWAVAVHRAAAVVSESAEVEAKGKDAVSFVGGSDTNSDNVDSSSLHGVSGRSSASSSSSHSASDKDSETLYSSDDFEYSFSGSSSRGYDSSDTNNGYESGDWKPMFTDQAPRGQGAMAPLSGPGGVLAAAGALAPPESLERWCPVESAAAWRTVACKRLVARHRRRTWRVVRLLFIGQASADSSLSLLDRDSIRVVARAVAAEMTRRLPEDCR